MKNAFLVSDDDLRSLRTEPWFIELNGPAVFLHESVLKLVQQANLATTVHRLHPKPNGAASLLCDQPTCPRSQPGQEFPSYSARQTHRAMSHDIAGEYANRPNVIAARQRRRSELLPPGATGNYPVSAYQNAASYKYAEFDAKGICGLNDPAGGVCPYKSDVIRSLHFHRSVNHGVRGINWGKTHKKRNKFKGKRSVGRPKKVAN